MGGSQAGGRDLGAGRSRGCPLPLGLDVPTPGPTHLDGTPGGGERVRRVSEVVEEQGGQQCAGAAAGAVPQD